MNQLLTDKPTIIDSLGYDIFSKGLVELIADCDTPITIGIHGKWGTGKTSLMMMVRERLHSLKNKGNKIQTVWFNPWQYQFEESAVIPLLQSIRDEASKNNWIPVNKLKALKIFNILGSLAGEALLRASTGGAVTSETILKQGLAFEEKYFETRTVAQRMREHFSDAVSNLAGDSQNARLVIFIDDLDRCLPEFVLKTLESIKLFLNVEKCVFIIAIDPNMIHKAISQRYGDATIVDTKDYLEKIIQLPFYLPAMLDQKVEEFITSISSDDGIHDYLQIVIQGIERNPRHVKRFLNSFILHDLLAQHANIVNYDKQILAKLLVVQFRWPILFQNFDILIELERTILEGQKQDRETLVKRERAIISQIDLAGITKFLKRKPYFFGIKNIADYVTMSRLSTPIKARVFREESRIFPIDVSKILKSDKKLTGANLMDASLKNYDFTDADLRGASLVGADLSGAKLLNTNLTGANLERANLINADVNGANFKFVNFWRANLSNIDNFDKIVSLEEANFYRVEGITNKEKLVIKNFQTIDLRNYDLFFEYFKNNKGMSNEEIRKIFKWSEHYYFKFIMLDEF